MQSLSRFALIESLNRAMLSLKHACTASSLFLSFEHLCIHSCAHCVNLKSNQNLLTSLKPHRQLHDLRSNPFFMYIGQSCRVVSYSLVETCIAFGVPNQVPNQVYTWYLMSRNGEVRVHCSQLASLDIMLKGTLESQELWYKSVLMLRTGIPVSVLH